MTRDSRVVVDVQDGIARITLNDPPSLNALSAEVAAELADVIAALSEDASTRCLVLTGAGRAFSAGGDVQSFYDHRDDPEAVMSAVLDGLHDAVERLLTAPFPTVAAINGVVAGAGMGVALATDLAVAVDSAVFTMAYTGIGVSPDGSSTYFLPRLIGARRAMELILTNRRLTATEALELGMINRVVATDRFDAEVDELAHALASGPTLAYVRARQLVMASFGADPVEQMAAEADAIVAAGSTRDFYEGVSAFIEKRPPTFTGA